MRLTGLGMRGLGICCALALCCGDASAPDTGDEAPASSEVDLPENGQTGALTPSGDCNPLLTAASHCCSSVDECQLDLRPWTEPNSDLRLIAARCEQAPIYSGVEPPPYSGLSVCKCRVGVLWEGLDVWQQSDLRVGSPDPRLIRSSCALENARFPGCAYCDAEFSGCRVDDATSCDAVCREVVERGRAERQTPHAVQQTLAECNGGRCEIRVEGDDACYAPYYRHLVPVSCDASNAELRAISDGTDLSSCEDPPARAPCTTAADCPGGLACDGRQCGGCGSLSTCGEPEADGALTCTSFDGYSCLASEACVAGVCVPSERVSVPDDCLDAASVSGIRRFDVRGNGDAVVRCARQREACFGLAPGQALRVAVHGSLQEPDAGAAAPVPGAPISCDARFADGVSDLGEGASFDLTIARQLSESHHCLLNVAEVASPLPAPFAVGTEPRAYEGSLGLAISRERLVLLSQAVPAVLAGCAGDWVIGLEHLGIDADAAQGSDASGGDAPLALHRRFDARNPMAPACVALLGSAWSCSDRRQVQLQRR